MNSYDVNKLRTLLSEYTERMQGNDAIHANVMLPYVSLLRRYYHSKFDNDVFEIKSCLRISISVIELLSLSLNNRHIGDIDCKLNSVVAVTKPTQSIESSLHSLHGYIIGGNFSNALTEAVSIAMQFINVLLKFSVDILQPHE